MAGVLAGAVGGLLAIDGKADADPAPGQGVPGFDLGTAQAEDFGEAFTPELREQEERLRARMEGQQKKA